MIQSIQLLRNIGTFDSVTVGSQLPLNRFALIYAENGRGKTTLAAVLRSLRSGDALPVLERKRLGVEYAPHAVLNGSGGQTAVFENGVWANRFADILVFDDYFVAENVCSGMVVETEHRQNLHELIVGAQGTALNDTLQGHVARIEQHNHDLRNKANAIMAEVRGGLSVDDFCALENRDDLDEAIARAERSLAAARDSDAVLRHAHFVPISLPAFDLPEIEDLLSKTLIDLEVDAAARVHAHLAKIGSGGEAWIGDGMARIEGVSAGEEHALCPFCIQNLQGSPLIAHYQAYFSDAYRTLRRSIDEQVAALRKAHSGEIRAAFERAVRICAETRQFWAKYVEIPEVAIDTAAVALAWEQAYETVLATLAAKQNAPLEFAEIGDDLRKKVAAYHKLRDQVLALSDDLQATHPQIDVVKEGAAAASIATLEGDLHALKVIQVRYSARIIDLCDDYLLEKNAKTETEELRDAARVALDQYREQVFPAYEVAINTYLQRFNAGFRLHSVNSVNTRAGSSCKYSVLINQTEVPLSEREEGQPSFRNTLSAGDRNTLALAFFFASLELDPDRQRKVVIVDDPISSLDEHRSLATIQEIRRLAENVEQLIVLSHSKSFLCDLWEGADTVLRSAIKIVRANSGSTLADWDVRQDCITEHDRRHEIVRAYIQNSMGADERAVAVALRPILESFLRVSYPEWFPPGALLGPFIGLCQQREGSAEQILSANDRHELRALLDYANQFHHDTNDTWQTAIINDHELLDFSQRTLRFARR